MAKYLGRVVLKSVRASPGELFVTTFGTKKIQMWFVDKLATPAKVSIP